MSSTTLPPVPQSRLRTADLNELVTLLQQQHRQKVDLVVPASTVRLNGGKLELAGIDTILSEEGVTDVNGAYRFTPKALGDLSGLFDIPVKYVRRLAEEHVALLDTNVNEWADRKRGQNVLVRAIYGSDPAHPDTSGIVRSILSDRFDIRDNLDTTFAVLDGVRQAGLAADKLEFRGADLADGKLWLRITAPEIYGEAPNLLRGYKSPFQGTGHGGEAAENPYVVYAGILVTNSEVGTGAFTITPELRVKVCDNGMTVNMDSMRKVHLGRKLDEGQVQWSAETRDAANALTQSQVKDAVSSFMSKDYVQGAINRLERDAGYDVRDPAKTIQIVGKELSFSEDEMALVLNHFTKGGQGTSGAVLNAVTSAAQMIEDIERSNEFAAAGVDAMRIAAKVNGAPANR